MEQKTYKTYGQLLSKLRSRGMIIKKGCSFMVRQDLLIAPVVEKDPIQQCVASFFFSFRKLLSALLFDGKLNKMAKILKQTR